MADIKADFLLMPKDTDAGLLFIFNKTHGSTPFNFIPDEPVKKHLAKIKTGETSVWGAFVSDELIGFVSMEPNSPYYLQQSPKQKCAAFIHEFVVDPKFRGHRVGQTLIGLCVNSQSDIFHINPAIQEVYTTAHAQNIPSIKAFIRAGFKEVVTFKDEQRKRNTIILKYIRDINGLSSKLLAHTKTRAFQFLVICTLIGIVINLLTGYYG
eukprot:892233_1